VNALLLSSALAHALKLKRVTRPVDRTNGWHRSLNGGQPALNQLKVNFAVLAKT